MTQPQEPQRRRVRRVRIERSAAVQERTLHDVIVPDQISDDAAADWALARAETGLLPAAVQELLPTMLPESEPTFRVNRIAYLKPSEPALSQGDHVVAVSEPDAALALRFLTPTGETCTLVGLSCCTLTYEWVRAGQDGEHLASIGANGATVAPDSACLSQHTPAWCARFSRSALALGGRFTAVEVIAGSEPLALSACSGNDENCDLTLEESEPQPLPSGVRVTAEGVRDITDGSLIVGLDLARGYWMLGGNCYSDVTISRR